MITMPPLQADIIRTALAAEPAVELVGEVSAPAAAEAVAATGAEVAILGDGEALSVTAFDLLAAHPRLKVLGMTGSGREAVLYECRPVMTRLGEASPRVLLDAIIQVRQGSSGILP
jgi:hypothetical protein